MHKHNESPDHLAIKHVGSRIYKTTFDADLSAIPIVGVTEETWRKWDERGNIVNPQYDPRPSYDLPSTLSNEVIELTGCAPEIDGISVVSMSSWLIDHPEPESFDRL